MNVLTKISFFVLLFLGIVYAGMKPLHNWDMIPYMACVIKKTNPTPEAYHAKTYDILREEVGEKEYKWLSSLEYTSTLESNHKAFSENLPYYTIRIVYVNMVSFFYQLGIPLTFSTVLPSLISVFCIILTLFFVLNRELKNSLVASTIAIIILFLPPMTNLARLSTPDSLSALFLLLITISYLYKRNWFLTFLLMSVSIMVRTDNIIWCIFLLLFEIASPSEKKNRWLIIAFMLGLSTIYFAINAAHANGGWEVLFYSTFIDRQSFPISMTPPLTVSNYIIAMIKQTPDFLPWILFIFLGYYYLKTKNINELIQSRGSKIILACVLTLLSKFVLFPSFHSRFHFVLVLILLITASIERKNLLKLYATVD